MRCSDQQDPRFVGDPVDVVTGVMSDMRPDLLPRGPISFEWTRYYASHRNQIIGPVGRGWSHQFQHRLKADLDGLLYENPEGILTEFPYAAVGESVIASGAQLLRLEEFQYRLTLPDQKLEFVIEQEASEAKLASASTQGVNLEFEFDAQGRLYGINDQQRRILIEWNSQGLIGSLVLLKIQSHQPAQTLIQYKYDSSLNLVGAVDFFDGVQTFAYDLEHRLIRRTDRRGYSFLFDYDELGRCIRSRGEDGVLDVQLEYRPEARTTFVQHDNGGRWIYSYDLVGNITHVTDPYGFAKRYEADGSGRTVKEIDANGNVTQLHYNWLGEHDYRVAPTGRVLPTLDEDDDPPDPLSYELPETALEWELGGLAVFGAAGKPSTNDPVFGKFPPSVYNQFCGVFESEEHVESEVSGDSIQHETIEAVAYPFDESLAPFASRSEFDRNGNIIEYQDRDGKVYRYTYQSWNLPLEEIDPLGHTDQFYYATNLELSRAIDARGTEHRFAYDLKDRLTEVHYGGKLLETFKYDAADNMVEKRDGRGELLLQWEIGAGNLDKSRRLADGALHEFEYDESGHLVKAAGPEGVVECQYDEDQVIGDMRDGLGVVHELSGSLLASTTYLDLFRVEYDWNDEGELVVRDPTGREHSIAFGERGRVLRNLANGSQELIQFDEEGRCRHKALLGRNGELWRRSFNYSGEGDLLRVDDNRFGATRFKYDDAHRLSMELRADHSRDYQYDSANNLVVQPGLERVSIATGNRLVSANGDEFQYDIRDNLISRSALGKTVRYTYDSLDRLIRCDINGEPWAAKYDPLGRRIQKTWKGKTTTFHWDDFRLAAEQRHDGSIRLYVYADLNALVPFMLVEFTSVESKPEEGKRYYVFTDQVGAPVRVEDDQGEAVWQVRLDPYGTANVVGTSDFEMPIRFPGHYHDSETGLHYNRFRYYCPELGRYIQPDPLGIEGGINLFAYVSNPLIEVDIDGLAKAPQPCGPNRRQKKSRTKPKRKGSRKTSANAKKLRKSMGGRITKKQEPHHIVPSTHKKGAPGRGVLKRVGIGVNDDANGSPLTNKEHHGQGLHSHAKIEEVNRRLKEAEDKGGTKAEKKKRVEAALRKIEREQKAGEFEPKDT